MIDCELGISEADCFSSLYIPLMCSQVVPFKKSDRTNLKQISCHVMVSRNGDPWQFIEAGEAVVSQLPFKESIYKPN
jgi:hypothetical protein